MKQDVKITDTAKSMNNDLPTIFVFTETPKEINISIKKDTTEGYSLKIDHKK
ncbi:hypothetical protein [uncultured Tenacibaculum sp.]|uniref:hypothetical protein n=1 Tax=uncultured Tenacibaculum sp. TaxID=174713 RepID=UPI00262BA8F5|nr:hypothetical protein [uncultured Tenacibaculum sp.]